MTTTPAPARTGLHADLPTIQLRAFNLWPGAVIWTPIGGRPELRVVVTVHYRDHDDESITVSTRPLRDATANEPLPLSTFDFCELIEVTGNVVNFDDYDDVDNGAL